MPIWDCFLYNGENDMLRLRCDTLASLNVVHILVEADETHTGSPKALMFDPALLEGRRYVYRAVGHLETHDPWRREAWQRNTLLQVLNVAGATDTDLALLGDIDEIPNPDALPVLDCPALTLLMQQSTWDARNVLHKPWEGTVLTTVGQLRDWSPEGTRRRRDILPQHACGWHYTWMGTLEAAYTKQFSISHTEFATSYYRERLADNRRNGRDPYGRDGQDHAWNDHATRPVPLWRYPERYPALWRDDAPRGLR